MESDSRRGPGFSGEQPVRPAPIDRRLGRSLAHRGFRLFFIAQAVSILGTWMHNVAQAWLVYRLTQSSLMLGLASFAALAPVLVGGLYGGMTADRMSRYRLAMLTHFGAMSVAMVLAILTLTGIVTVWHILALALLLGVTHAFGIPARHAFVAQLVPRQDLSNAIALHSAAFNAARFIGPALAGALVVVSNEGAVFLVNALSYAVFLLLMARLPAPDREREREGGPPGLKVALAHAWEDGRTRGALLLVGLAGLVGTPYIVLMPVFAAEVYGGGADTLGWLMAAAGAGSLLGAVALAQRTGEAGLERLAGVAGLLGAGGLLALAMLGALYQGLLVLPLVGFALTIVIAAANILVQLRIPDQMRGRAVALFSVVFLGASPIGNLLAGAVAEAVGVRVTVAGCALLLGAGALIYLRDLGGRASAGVLSPEDAQP